MSLLGRGDEGQQMRSTYSREQPFLAGETVTGGRFECMSCHHQLEKEPGIVVNLPVCPNCQCDRWEAAR